MSHSHRVAFPSEPGFRPGESVRSLIQEMKEGARSHIRVFWRQICQDDDDFISPIILYLLHGTCALYVALILSRIRQSKLILSVGLRTQRVQHMRGDEDGEAMYRLNTTEGLKRGKEQSSAATFGPGCLSGSFVHADLYGNCV